MLSNEPFQGALGAGGDRVGAQDRIIQRAGDVDNHRIRRDGEVAGLAQDGVGALGAVDGGVGADDLGGFDGFFGGEVGGLFPVPQQSELNR